jgi:hypothetical protein
MAPLTAEQIDELRARAEKIANASPNGAHPGSGAGVDGAALLDDVRVAVTRYVAFPSLAAAFAVTLWIGATHAQTAWEHATRLIAKSPLRGCGKTRLLEVAGALVHNPLLTANVSVAALVRSISDDDPPTIFLDEGDTIFAKRRGERSESAEDLRGIINAGHSRGWPYIRWNASTRQTEQCPTFAMAAIAAIGDLPDTIEHRSVVIEMQRRAPSESILAFRRRNAPALHDLRDRLHAWIASNQSALGEADPPLPVEDRAADVWAPLVAIADLAGGEWPERARDACRELCAAAADPDVTAAERLLADLQEIFGESERMSTTAILDKLNALEESPWGDWYGHQFRARDLARLLRPYQVRSRNIRTPAGVVKGYDREDFEGAWERYLRTPSATGATTLQTEESVSKTGVADAANESATHPLHPTDANSISKSGAPDDECSGVADVADGVPDGDLRHREVLELAERFGYPPITLRDPIRRQIIRISIAEGRDNWIAQLDYADEATVKDIIEELKGVTA